MQKRAREQQAQRDLHALQSRSRQPSPSQLVTHRSGGDSRPPSAPQPSPPAPTDAEQAAAKTIQARARGERQRDRVHAAAEPQAAEPPDELGLATVTTAELELPYLYVQTRHVPELTAMLPAAMGSKHASVRFQPTACYTIRHSTVAPTSSLVEPPLAGLLVRQRSLAPQPVKMVLGASSDEREALERLPRRASVLSPAVRVQLSAGMSFVGAQAAGAVPAIYARRQLVRVVLPSADLLNKVYQAARKRNAALLTAMGLEGSEAQNPKVLSELLLPLQPRQLNQCISACTIQRMWRAYVARTTRPQSLARSVLRLRATLHVQLWWRWWLVKERIRMLTFVRGRVEAATTNKLYLPTAVYEELRGKMPLHQTGLWPEHKGLEFTFATGPDSPIQLFVDRSALRSSLSRWCAPPVPVAIARSYATPQEPLSLLSTGVRAALTNRSRFGKFVKQDWTCVSFFSSLEAARRSALLAAIAYEPLAMRTRHGRLQGMLLPPVALMNVQEVIAHEAAAYIQAAFLSRHIRAAVREMLLQARANRAEQERLRVLRQQTNSLFAGRGELQVEATVARPMGAEVDALGPEGRRRLKIEVAVESQVEHLQLVGLRPVVGALGPVGAELGKYVARSAAIQREESAAAKEELMARRAAEEEAARQRVAETSMRGGEVHPPSPRVLAQLMSQLTNRVEPRAASFLDEVALMRAEMTHEKRVAAAVRRAEALEAREARESDREQERKELTVQARLEKHDLRFAVAERRRVLQGEVAQLAAARRARSEGRERLLASREFTSAFVRQQNAMGRQLQLGELRRARDSELVSATVTTHSQHANGKIWQQRLATDKGRRAMAVRESVRVHRHEVALEIAKKQTEREQELAIIHNKQKQLREIKRMLTEPVAPLASAGSGLEMVTGVAAGSRGSTADVLAKLGLA